VLLLLRLLLLLCRYHDCFMDDVYINIVMEYCNAGDLTVLLKQRSGQRLPEPEIMSLFVQVRCT
jgi:serine/threonine protein kinase